MFIHGFVCHNICFEFIIIFLTLLLLLFFCSVAERFVAASNIFMWLCSYNKPEQNDIRPKESQTLLEGNFQGNQQQSSTDIVRTLAEWYILYYFLPKVVTCFDPIYQQDTVLKKSSIPKNTMDKSDRQKVWWMFWFHFVSILRPDDAAGCPGHSGGEEVAGDSHKRGEPERREEGWGLPLVVPRSGEQEREEGDPGLWTGQSKRHHGAGRVRAKMALSSIHLQKCMRKLQY